MLLKKRSSDWVQRLKKFTPDNRLVKFHPMLAMMNSGFI
jgi:hypothetical protein